MIGYHCWVQSPLLAMSDDVTSRLPDDKWHLVNGSQTDAFSGLCDDVT